MKQVAERVSAAIQETFPEAHLLGVSYYDEDGVGHVYRSDRRAEEYDAERVDEIVEDLRLESISFGAHERRQAATLHATARLYDKMLDISVPVAETEGIVVALHRAGDYRARKVVDLVEEVADDSDLVE